MYVVIVEGEYETIEKSFRWSDDAENFAHHAISDMQGFISCEIWYNGQLEQSF